MSNIIQLRSHVRTADPSTSAWCRFLENARTNHFNWQKVIARVALQLPCPRCEADAGERCVTRGGRVLSSDVHEGRWFAGRDLLCGHEGSDAA